MLPEIEARVNKALGSYRNLEANLLIAAERARGSGGITQRQRRRESDRLTLLARTALTDSKPHMVAAIKLSYVRGARTEEEGYRLDDQDLAVVQDLADASRSAINAAIGSSMRNVQAVFSRLGMAAIAESGPTNEARQPLVDVLRGKPLTLVVDSKGRRWSLEEYCHTALAKAAASAFTRGALAAKVKQLQEIANG